MIRVVSLRYKKMGRLSMDCCVPAFCRGDSDIDWRDITFLLPGWLWSILCVIFFGAMVVYKVIDEHWPPGVSTMLFLINAPLAYLVRYPSTLCRFLTVTASMC
eukprot:GHVS01064499.1.p2 GENE.GHVS01064499.1~~GHVS01064499.1.p2  ORF type:complete len:103 (+),score=9.35 GHVS01064499.1:3-311(+)